MKNSNDTMDTGSMQANKNPHPSTANNHGGENFRSPNQGEFYKSILNFQEMGSLKALGYEPAISEKQIEEALLVKEMLEQKSRELERINQALIVKHSEGLEIQKYIDHENNEK